jgi:DUF1365 family protein
MHSAIYDGRLRHRRFRPIEHVFDYPLFMLYLDLDELPALFRNRWLWSADRPALARFERADHFGDREIPLTQAVRDRVERESGVRPEGPVRLLTHLSYFGYRFNPVSFFYCFDAGGRRLEAIVAEVNNTPWGEQHCYVLTGEHDGGKGAVKRYVLDKQFHVSPFMEMNMLYDWRFTTPGPGLTVHMESWDEGCLLFDATLTLNRRAITTWSLNWRLLRYPAMTAQIITRIYWQAFRLWLKRYPFVPHPSKVSPTEVLKR